MTMIRRTFLLAVATISCLLLGSAGANEHRVRGSKRAVVESTTTTTIDRDDDKRRLLVANSLVDTPTHHLGGNTLSVRNLVKNKKSSMKASKKEKMDKMKDSDNDDEAEDDEMMCFGPCDPAGVNLEDYPQWQAEEGYWIGELTFYGSDGTPFSSANWNYRYDSYRGFITGNVNGNAYRQRNVFFYPPQSASVCETNPAVQGVGACGVNGNTKIFSADQNATACSTNPELAGDIAGPFADVFDTTTELVGADNALLYQVFLFGQLFQSQLTTLSTVPETGEERRTRTAQSFRGGVPSNASFYRERKVTKEEFYAEMAATMTAYNVLESDVCAWVDNPSFNPPVIETGLPAGLAGCMQHLEESFAL